MHLLSSLIKEKKGGRGHGADISSHVCATIHNADTCHEHKPVVLYFLLGDK